MVYPRQPRMRSPRKSAWMSASCKKSALLKGNTWRLRLRGKAAPPPRFLPRLFPTKSPRFTGRRICTGGSAGKFLFVRCAGWWRCSMSRLCRWNCLASARAELRADIASLVAGRSPSPSPAPMLKRCAARRFSVPPSVSTRSVRPSTRPLAPSPGRAGAKTRRWLQPSSI